MPSPTGSFSDADVVFEGRLLGLSRDGLAARFRVIHSWKGSGSRDQRVAIESDFIQFPFARYLVYADLRPGLEPQELQSTDGPEMKDDPTRPALRMDSGYCSTNNPLLLGRLEEYRSDLSLRPELDLHGRAPWPSPRFLFRTGQLWLFILAGGLLFQLTTFLRESAFAWFGLLTLALFLSLRLRRHAAAFAIESGRRLRKLWRDELG